MPTRARKSKIEPHAYGYVRDTHDERDFMLEATTPVTLPRRVMLADAQFMPPVWDQLQLGSCTAHGVLGAFLYCAARNGVNDPMLSRLQLYYNARALEGTTDQDAGAQIRDAIKATKSGIAPESDWPYKIANFAKQPPVKAQTDAAQNLGLHYARVRRGLHNVQHVLAEGWPVVDGMPVYESMESPEAAQTGQVPMPAQGEQLMGYHCTLTVGYDLDADDGHGGTGVLYKRNSWGLKWGMLDSFPGYFSVPLAYYSMITDTWRITSVS